MMQSPIITDHAVLKYLERNVGIDIENYRRFLKEQVMNDPRTRKGIDDLGDIPRFKIIKDEVTFCMNGEVVITCYPTKKKKRKSSNRRKSNEHKYLHRQFESTE